MSTGKDYGLPEEFADWVEAKPPLRGRKWVSIEIRTGGIGSAVRVLSRRYFVPPKPKPTLPDVGHGGVVRFKSKSGGTYRIMRASASEKWWIDQFDSDWYTDDLLDVVDDDGFTMELEGL